MDRRSSFAYSPLYDLDTKDMAPFDLLTRYMASDPVGDTHSLGLASM